MPAGPEQQRLKLIAQAFGSRKEVRITASRPRTKAKPNKMPKMLLTRQFQQTCNGSGATVGLPDLRAGRKVQIEGLGDALFGNVLHHFHHTHHRRRRISHAI